MPDDRPDRGDPDPERGPQASPQTSPSDLLDELELRPPRINGTTAREVTATHIRDLTTVDLQALEGPRGASVAPSIKKLRASHHALARCLATGMKSSEASLITGYTQNRICILQNDPAFMTLVNDYKMEAREFGADMQERMLNISLDALEELHERLHDEPESFSVGTLLDTIKIFADRTGYGPGQEVKVSLSATLIDRPPKESYEEWQRRRARELGADGSLEPDILSLVPPTRTTN